MKKLLIFVLVLLIAIAGGTFWFLNSDQLNVLIKEQIELQGSKLTEQKVTVVNVDMQLLHGAGTIKGVVINNPKGYSSMPLFSLGKTTLDINLQSLGAVSKGGPIVIDTIVIDKPEALVEFNETGGSNMQDMLAIIEKNSPKSAEPVQTANPEQTNQQTTEPLIRIKKFVLSGVALRVDLTKLGNTTHTKILADISLSNIGGDNGIPASQLGSVMFKKALSAIWKQAKKEQKEVLKDQVKDKVKDKASELFNKWKKDN